MTVLAGIIAPHAPVLIPEIGGPRVSDATSTVEALKRASTIIDGLAPETLIFISPHSQIVDGGFAIQIQSQIQGSFSQFGAGDIRFSIDNDLEAVEKISQACRRLGVPLCPIDDPGVDGLDWGVLLPYWFMGQGRPIVSLSISVLPNKDHYLLGRGIWEALSEPEKNYVFVASGDLSHRLSDDSPYGYSPQGIVFDERVKKIVKGGRLDEFLKIDKNEAISAGECGLRSFITLAGVLSELVIDAQVLSYEGPFGIGYLVGILLVRNE